MISFTTARFPRARRREIDVLPGSAAQHRIRSFSPCVRVMVITLPRTLGGLPSENKVMYMYIVYASFITFETLAKSKRKYCKEPMFCCFPTL